MFLLLICLHKCAAHKGDDEDFDMDMDDKNNNRISSAINHGEGIGGDAYNRQINLRVIDPWWSVHQGPPLQRVP